MTEASDLSQERPGSKRRIHKKSRRGCRNCKLRRVKCDEIKPHCKNCRNYGFHCNFDLKVPDLHVSVCSTTAFNQTGNLALWTNPTFLDLSLKMKIPPGSLYLDNEGQAMLRMFENRTALSLGTKRSSLVFQNVAVKLAVSRHYIMHLVQALTSVHDRYLSQSSNTQQTLKETYHLSQAIEQFNGKLSKRIADDERDSIWAAAVMLGIATFAIIEGSVPEQVWPLSPSSPNDLDWLRMSEMKKAVHSVIDPERAGSVFSGVSYGHQDRCLHPMPTQLASPGLSSKFVRFFNIGHSSTPENNPYYTAVKSIMPLFDLQYEQSILITFLGLVRDLEAAFRMLLELKDPRALLALAYWFSNVCNSVWWIERRARLQCQAICIYLERYHAYDTSLQELLLFPKLVCGLPIQNTMVGTSPKQYGSDICLDELVKAVGSKKRASMLGLTRCATCSKNHTFVFDNLDRENTEQQLA